jgi:uncharacterized SAM-binding protein YcdF (DUF218 family)
MNGFFLPGLTLVFITLKLMGIITWNWFFVLSPMIIGVVLAGSIAFFIYYNLSNEQKSAINSKLLVGADPDEKTKHLTLLLNQAINNFRNKE